MAIGRDGYRYAQLAGCVANADTYLLTTSAARRMIDEQIDAVHAHWADVSERAELTAVDRGRLWGRQILNPYALHEY